MDEDRLKSVYAPVALRVLEAWRLAPARVEFVHVMENVTFRAERGGQKYVLRFHRPGYNTHAEMVSERMWLRALAASGLSVPEGVPTPEGREFVAAEVDGEERLVGLARWVEGEPLDRILARTDDLERIEAYFEAIGRLAAGVHNASSNWTPPPQFTRRAWDADGLVGESPLWGRFWEVPDFSADECRTLARARAHIRERLLEYGTDGQTYGLIHADLHPGNVLVDRAQARLIDFDDAGFGWHVHELAVALFNNQTSPHFGAMQAALVRGYRSRRQLADEDLELLPLFLLMRNLMVIGWMEQRPELRALYRRFRDSVKASALLRIEALGPG
ncbi:MAG: phosphotransferase [Gammaproteobacteria bacterium]|nr:phosphotransferase [Gammaproteobacteria bacterium]